MSKMRAPKLFAATALVALALVGCSSGSSGAVNPVGTWGSEGDGEPNLVLTDDGKLAGTDGCNRLMGSWTAEKDVVDFGQVASTMMACQNVDTWLSGLATGKISGDTITVFDESGGEIGSLKRA